MKRILCLLLVIFFTAALFPANASAEKKPFTLWMQAVPGTPGAAERVNYWFISSAHRYIFLPASWQADQLYLFYEGANDMTVNGKSFRSGDRFNWPLDQEITVSGYGVYPFGLTVMQSARIPAVFIATESGDMQKVQLKKGTKEPGTLTYVNPDGSLEYDGALQYIRGRGNSTFNYPKKPYQIKLDKSTPLGGMSQDKTFILLANYLDRSEIRNTLALDLARYSGAYAFTPRYQPVDLYLNNSYAGCYLLTEKCEIGSNRLPIANLESAVEKLNEVPLETFPFVGNRTYHIGATRAYEIPRDPEDITGGYLILANNTEYFQTEASGFVTDRGQAFTTQQPKYASVAQLEYIGGVMQAIENALYAKDGRDPATGRHYTEMLDMKSFVNRYLQSEVLLDYDGHRPYFYKDSDLTDPMVYCGPVWDQDNILGASARLTDARYIALENNQRRPYYWFTQAMRQSDFKAEMIRTYYEVYRPACLILLGEAVDPSGTLRSIDEYMDEIRASAAMDNTRWNKTIWNQQSGGNPRAGNNLNECAEYLKNFIRVRMAALDKAYPR